MGGSRTLVFCANNDVTNITEIIGWTPSGGKMWSYKFNGSLVSQGYSYANYDFNLVEFTSPGTLISAWQNGTNKFTDLAFDQSTIPQIYGSIGCARENNGSWIGQYWAGDIAEIIIYNSDISVANRQRVDLYLNTEAQGTGYAIY